MKTYGKHRFPGRLFVVEGIDGSGKSTQLALLQKWLESEGYGTFFSEWNSSALVRDVTRRGKKKRMLTPMTFSLIAHHLATIQAADMIFVVKDHRLAERGTHAELLAAGGFYAELHGIQFAPADAGVS